MLHAGDIQRPSSRFYENLTSTSDERSAARKLPPAAADSPSELGEPPRNLTPAPAHLAAAIRATTVAGGTR